MSSERDVVVLSAVRTAIGRYGGSLKDHPPTDLAATVVREAVKRAGVAASDVGHVVFGNVIHTDIHDMYLSRVSPRSRRACPSRRRRSRSTGCAAPDCRPSSPPRRS